jgi:putative alpha-1,2-mannosidase
MCCCADCGQMSAWYIYNALGFYPVNPASGEYVIGTPKFDKVDVRFPQTPAHTKISSKLTITANGAADNQYVRGVSLNGKVLKSPILTHQQVMAGLHLDFDMSNEEQTWSVDTI